MKILLLFLFVGIIQCDDEDDQSVSPDQFSCLGVPNTTEYISIYTLSVQTAYITSVECMLSSNEYITSGFSEIDSSTNDDLSNLIMMFEDGLEGLVDMFSGLQDDLDKEMKNKLNSVLFMTVEYYMNKNMTVEESDISLGNATASTDAKLKLTAQRCETSYSSFMSEMETLKSNSTSDVSSTSNLSESEWADIVKSYYEARTEICQKTDVYASIRDAFLCGSGIDLCQGSANKDEKLLDIYKCDDLSSFFGISNQTDATELFNKTVIHMYTIYKTSLTVIYLNSVAYSENDLALRILIWEQLNSVRSNFEYMSQNIVTFMKGIQDSVDSNCEKGSDEYNQAMTTLYKSVHKLLITMVKTTEVHYQRSWNFDSQDTVMQTNYNSYDINVLTKYYSDLLWKNNNSSNFDMHNADNSSITNSSTDLAIPQNMYSMEINKLVFQTVLCDLNYILIGMKTTLNNETNANTSDYNLMILLKETECAVKVAKCSAIDNKIYSMNAATYSYIIQETSSNDSSIQTSYITQIMNQTTIDVIGTLSINTKEIFEVFQEVQIYIDQNKNSSLSSPGSTSTPSTPSNGTYGTSSTLSNGTYGSSSTPSSNGTYGTSSTLSNGTYGTLSTPSNGTYGTSSTLSNGTYGTSSTPSSNGTYGTSSTLSNGTYGTSSTLSNGTYGTPSTPSSNGTYGTSSTLSNGTYGTSSTPSSNGTYGTSSTLSNGTYGTLSTPSNGTYGTSSTLSNGTYGTSSTLSNGTYGTPSTPSSNGTYGTSSTPSNGTYGTSSTLSNGTYGTSSTPSNGTYGTLSTPSNGTYGTSSTLSNGTYGTSSTLSNGTYGTLSTPSNGTYGTSSTLSNGTYGTSSTLSNGTYGIPSTPSSNGTYGTYSPSPSNDSSSTGSTNVSITSSDQIIQRIDSFSSSVTEKISLSISKLQSAQESDYTTTVSSSIKTCQELFQSHIDYLKVIVSKSEEFLSQQTTSDSSDYTMALNAINKDTMIKQSILSSFLETSLTRVNDYPLDSDEYVYINHSVTYTEYMNQFYKFFNIDSNAIYNSDNNVDSYITNSESTFYEISDTVVSAVKAAPDDSYNEYLLWELDVTKTVYQQTIDSMKTYISQSESFVSESTAKSQNAFYIDITQQMEAIYVLYSGVLVKGYQYAQSPTSVSMYDSEYDVVLTQTSIVEETSTTLSYSESETVVLIEQSSSESYTNVTTTTEVTSISTISNYTTT